MDKEQETELARRIGATIAKHRVKLAMTQEAVAERLGIGYEAISRIERGIVMPTIARLIEFADVFDCTVEALLTEISTRPVDQAKHLESVLAGLPEDDRTLILEFLDKFAIRLRIAGK
jgi:transcriptional regulator with XRE-family HTH domain